MEVSLLAIITAIVVSAVAAAVWTRKSKPPAIRDREILSVPEIMERHYKATGVDANAVATALDAIGSAFHVDPGQIRPSDRFSEELRVNGWEDYDSPLDELAHELRLIAGNASDLRHIETVDDVIRLVSGSNPKN